MTAYLFIMAYKIYSIESRKGGVGKTTIALNLAKLLLRKGPVLLLDCDVTGTSVSDPAKNSPFWAKDAHVLSFVDDNGDEHELNLLHYFLEDFIKGRGKVKNIIRADDVRSSKINVAGSLIGGKSKEALRHTMWLMDELHSYWLMEFIQHIICEFESLFSKKTVHVIIDTSPGFTGFSQALHDVMLDKGPDISKILMVATLDGQDIQATMDAAEEYNSAVSDRMKVARYFLQTEELYSSDSDDKENDDEVNKREYRNPEVESLISHKDDLKDFFFRLIDEDKMLEAYTQKKYRPSDYMGVVLNKIPQAIKDNETVIAFAEILQGRNFPLFCELTFAIHEVPQTKIFFEEAIAYQYYLRYLRNSHSGGTKDEYWNRRFRDIEAQIAESEIMDKIEASEKLKMFYVNLRQNVRDRKFAQIARQMTEAWSPTYGTETFKRELAAYSKYLKPNTEIGPNLTKDMLRVWIGELVHTIYDLTQRREDLRPLESLLTYMENYAGWGNEHKDERMMMSLAVVLYAFVTKLAKDYQPNLLLIDYIRDEVKNYPFGLNWRVLLEGHIQVNPRLIFQTEGVIRQYGDSFDKLYKTFCRAWLRLIAVQDDFRVVWAALKLYVPSSPGESFSNEMIDYINAVIGKIAVFSEDRLSIIKANSYIMMSVQEILQNYIYRQWN